MLLEQHLYTDTDSRQVFGLHEREVPCCKWDVAKILSQTACVSCTSAIILTEDL